MIVFTWRDQLRDSSIMTPRNLASLLRSMAVLEITKGAGRLVWRDRENIMYFVFLSLELNFIKIKVWCYSNRVQTLKQPYVDVAATARGHWDTHSQLSKQPHGEAEATDCRSWNNRLQRLKQPRNETGATACGRQNNHTVKSTYATKTAQLFNTMINN